MADKEYELPQIVALALQTQRGELLKALGPQHSEELVKGMSQDTCEQLLNLIADLIDDRYKLKCKVRARDEVLTRVDDYISGLAEDAQRMRESLGELDE
jgi:hypothetical protein